MLKKILLIALVLISFYSQGQQMFSNAKDYDIFRNYTKWGIQLDGLGYFPAHYTGFQKYSFQTQYAIGYQFGLIYNINLNNHFGFKIGALAGQVPAINTYFVLDKSLTGNANDYQHKEWPSYSPIFNYSFPVLLEYRNFSIDRYIISLNAGIHVARTSAATITDTYKNFYLTKVENPGSWDIDLVLKAGWYFQFKPLMLQTSIVYKHRFIDQYTGYFQFDNLQNEQPIKGFYTQKGDYIGLSFDFYFHKRAREVDMGCRANTQSKQVKKRQARQQREKEKARKRQEKIKKKKAKKMQKKAKKKWIFW